MNERSNMIKWKLINDKQIGIITLTNPQYSSEHELENFYSPWILIVGAIEQSSIYASDQCWLSKFRAAGFVRCMFVHAKRNVSAE